MKQRKQQIYTPPDREDSFKQGRQSKASIWGQRESANKLLEQTVLTNIIIHPYLFKNFTYWCKFNILPWGLIVEIQIGIKMNVHTMYGIKSSRKSRFRACGPRNWDCPLRMFVFRQRLRVVLVNLQKCTVPLIIPLDSWLLWSQGLEAIRVDD